MPVPHQAVILIRRSCSLSVTSLSWNITPCFSELITMSISKCMKCQMPPCHPNRRQGEHALHFCAACLGGLCCKLYFTLAFLFPIFYSKQKIVPNSLLLEGGNLWLLAECHKPQIWKSCCGEAVFYSRAGHVLAAREPITFIYQGKNRIKQRKRWN